MGNRDAKQRRQSSGSKPPKGGDQARSRKEFQVEERNPSCWARGNMGFTVHPTKKLQRSYISDYELMELKRNKYDTVMMAYLDSHC